MFCSTLCSRGFLREYFLGAKKNQSTSDVPPTSEKKTNWFNNCLENANCSGRLPINFKLEETLKGFLLWPCVVGGLTYMEHGECMPCEWMNSNEFNGCSWMKMMWRAQLHTWLCKHSRVQSSSIPCNVWLYSDGFFLWDFRWNRLLQPLWPEASKCEMHTGKQGQGQRSFPAQAGKREWKSQFCKWMPPLDHLDNRYGLRIR